METYVWFSLELNSRGNQAGHETPTNKPAHHVTFIILQCKSHGLTSLLRGIWAMKFLIVCKQIDILHILSTCVTAFLFYYANWFTHPLECRFSFSLYSSLTHSRTRKLTRTYAFALCSTWNYAISIFITTNCCNTEKKSRKGKVK